MQKDISAKWVAKAQAAKKNHNWEQALLLWDKCIRNFDQGKQPWWHTEYANALLELDCLEKAYQKYTDLTLAFPDFPGGYVGLARLAAKRCDWDLALSCWERCLTRFDTGDHPWWQVNYGTAFIELKRFKEAKKTYQKLIVDFPDFAPGYAGLARVAQAQQDWKQAAYHWQKCFSRFTENNPWWLKAYAHSLIEMGKLNEAIKVLDPMKESVEQDQHILELFARVNYLSGHLDQCLHYADQLITHYPQSPRGYFWSEQIMIKRGRFARAADFYLARQGDKTDQPEKNTIPDNYPPDLVLPPLTGNGNDYGFIEEKLKEFQKNPHPFTLAMSIIIPIHNCLKMLSTILAALVSQTYPPELLEIIITGGGESTQGFDIVREFKNHLNLHHVSLENKGSPMAALLNLGIRSASHDYIILLDHHTIPDRDLARTYAGYFHVSQEAVLFDVSQSVRPEDCVENNLRNTIFPSLMLDAGMAFPKAAIQTIGFFDEDFPPNTGETIEFGYRLYNRGYYFIPVKATLARHQRPLANTDKDLPDRKPGLKTGNHMLQQKCPIPGIRNYRADLTYQIPKVSVYIPAYNVEPFIKEAVDSALGQTFTDLEVVIYDDGSTDGTAKILKDHYTANPRVRWVSKKINRGIAAANHGAVSMCRGMYIGQLDGDDILEPQAVEKMVQFLDNNNVGVVYSCHHLVDRLGRPMRKISSMDFSRERLLVDMICTAFRMFRKRDWCRTGGFDVSLINAEDYDMMLKFSEVCQFAYLPQFTYKYRYHGKNTSLVNRAIHEKNHMVAINSALRRMGLADQWQAVSGPETNRRYVTFQRLI